MKPASQSLFEFWIMGFRVGTNRQIKKAMAGSPSQNPNGWKLTRVQQINKSNYLKASTLVFENQDGG